MPACTRLRSAPHSPRLRTATQRASLRDHGSRPPRRTAGRARDKETAVPHEQMNDRQVAAYVHLDHREVLKLASRGQIPCRKVAGRFIFHKDRIDHWIETHMHTLAPERLAGIERGVREHHGFDDAACLVSRLIPPGAVAVPMHAKSREKVLRALVDLADSAGLVHARDELLDELRRREALCTTALMPGLALPHPRRPVPYDIAASFVVAGVTPTGIPYGCPDGSRTRLFFLICCKDDRSHLHVLSRLAQMLHDPSHVEELTAARNAEEFRRILRRLEHDVTAPADGE